MKIAFKAPGLPAIITETDSSLRKMQALIGGSIDAVSIEPRLGMRLTLYVHEGLLLGLQPNLELPGNRLIVGPVVVSADDEEGEARSLTDEEEEAALAFLDERTILREVSAEEIAARSVPTIVFFDTPQDLMRALLGDDEEG